MDFLYQKCPQCNFVTFDPQRKLTRLEEPCPHCNSTGQIRIAWPNLEGFLYLTTIEKQDLNSLSDKNVAIVFLCTLLEGLLDNVVEQILYTHTNSSSLIKLTLKSNQGRVNRIKLFNSLNDRSIKEILDSIGLPNFLKDWQDLAEVRNTIAHGKPIGTNQNPTLFNRVLDDCFKAFMAIHNDVQRFKAAQ